MNCPNRKTILKLICTALILFFGVKCAAAIQLRYAEYLGAGHIVPTFLLICLVLMTGVLFMLLLVWKAAWLSPLWKLKSKLPFFSQLMALILCLIPALLYNFLQFSEPYGNIWIRAFIFIFIIVLSAWVMERENVLTFSMLIRSSLIFSVAFALCYQFRDASAYPFSLGWSEGNRIWDYSVLFGKDLYNFPRDQIIPAYIDIGRQSLWGLIFLLPKVSILLMRCWNDFLFTIPCAILGWLLFRKTPQCGSSVRLAVSLWAMLFLMQGPIYTPLTLAVILIALVRKAPLWLYCLCTALAGFYAVMSRSTWIALPAAFAAIMVFIEVPDSDVRRAKERWIRVIALGLSGFAGAIIYMKREIFSGLFGGAAKTVEVVESVASASSVAAMEAVPPIFTPAWFQYYFSRQALLWDRLWPNETYAPGIVLGLLGAILPVILLIIIWNHQRKWTLDFWQRFLLFAGPGVFMLVGLVISVKIGGGSNLHNLDMFLILLLLIASLAWQAGLGDWLMERIRAGSWLSLIVLAAILIPVYSSVFEAVPHVYPSQETTDDALDKIRETIEAHPDEEILFLDQRQLLTFGYVQKLPLIADYEKKWMMDMAMSNDAAFFEPYIRDMKEHRFAAIISEPLHIKFQGAGQDFSEENDLFVTWVSVPALCYYEPYETFPEQGVQILVPRESVLEQDGVTCP